MEPVEPERLLTVEQVESIVAQHKDTLCRKVKQYEQLSEQKKDTNKSYNESLKVIKEEVNFELETLDVLQQRKKELSA